LTVALLVIVLSFVGVFLSSKLRISYTTVLVAIGFLLSLFRIAGGLSAIPLDRTTILGLVVPPLIFEAAMRTRYEVFKASRVTVLSLAIFGVIISALVTGPSPAPMLIETAKNLEAAGADFIVMPCNTAHFWIEEIRRAVTIPIVDMIEETAKETARSCPSLRTVGIMAATGTVRSGLYQRQLRGVAIKAISPTDNDQATLMRAIYSVKAGYLSRASATAIEIGQRLVKAGAEKVISGCTKISLILKTGDLPLPIIDATQIPATRTVEIAQGIHKL
jgi:aspartate racemase